MGRTQKMMPRNGILIGRISEEMLPIILFINKIKISTLNASKTLSRNDFFMEMETISAQEKTISAQEFSISAQEFFKTAQETPVSAQEILKTAQEFWGTAQEFGGMNLGCI